MKLLRRIHFLLSQDRQRREVEEEMRLHRELRARQLQEQGLACSEASQTAARLFGNETLLKEKANDMWGWNWLEDLERDWRQTGRMLAANRGFAAIAVLTLALGIGANTAIFSVTNALLLKSLPVADPLQLYRVNTTRMPNSAGNTGNSRTSFSDYVFENLRGHSAVLSALVAYVPLGSNKISVRAGTLPEEVSADMVSGNFFSGLGVQAACGRVLSAEDETAHTPFAEVSYQYAGLRFGDACAAIGKPMNIKGVPFTIVGVAASGFKGVEQNPTDVWIPFQVRPELNAWGSAGKDYYSSSPNWWCILMMARLKPGVSKAAAESALNPNFQRAAYEPLGGKPRQGERLVRLSLVPARGIDGSESLKQPLLIVQVMVGLLLVIACGNVLVLLSVRNAARAREFCVRLALGGSRGRLIRQLLAESVVLVAGGTALGLIFAVVATRALSRWAELDIAATPDGTVLLFTLLISVAAALTFGIGPAFSASRVAIAESIKNSAATAHRERRRVAAGNVLTAVQLALCLMLLTGTGLLVRTLQNLQHVNVGFPTSGLLVFGISPQIQAQDKAEAFYRDLLVKLRSVPQVRSVTLMGNRVASGWSNNTDAYVDGQTPKNVDDTMLRWNDVGPDFFTTLGIPLLAGRDFNEADTTASSPVAIVNRAFVKHFLHGQNALGHTASFTGRKAFSIVGVVEDSKYTGVEEDPQAMAWFPYTQVGYSRTLHVELRTAGPAMAALPAVRKAVAEFAPDLALLQPRTQQAEFDRSISTEILLARLSTAFAVLAVILVTIGLYGTISYSVKRRTTEVGIRLALGAERGSVVWMILRSGILLSLLGLAIGMPLVFVSSRFLASLLYGVTPLDPLSIAGAALGILAVAVLATGIPARRAAAIDPLTALRYE
jgi:predicted permease